MTASAQHRNAKQKQDLIWDSFMWWAGLAVAVLAVPSVAIVFASIMPFRSDVAESIIFVLLCWTCTYLGMHLMKFYGLNITQHDAPERVKKVAAGRQQNEGALTMAPPENVQNNSYIAERRKNQNSRREETLSAMLCSSNTGGASKEHYNP